MNINFCKSKDNMDKKRKLVANICENDQSQGLRVLVCCRETWKESRDICGTRGKFNAHTRMCLKKRARTTCEICAKTFSNRNNMRRHMGEIHERVRGRKAPPPGPVLRCRLCPREFKSRPGLDYHRKWWWVEGFSLRWTGRQWRTGPRIW